MDALAEPLLLVTGFGPFPGVPVNPTAWLVEDLRADPPAGLRVVTAVLDVTYDVWETSLATLVESHRPDAVIAFGFSARASGFTIETTARNVFDPARPDARGALPGHARIDETGPDTLASTLTFDHACAVSDDAGSYICNLTLYRLIESGARATFVHLPELPLDELRAGSRVILSAAAAALRSV